MKNLLFMLTILLLVGCKKEEKQIYDKWYVYEHYTRSTNTANWKWLNPYEGVVTITKDSWNPLIHEDFGKVTTNPDGTIILENQENIYYDYVYNKSTEILQLNTYINDIWVSKEYLKRK